MRVGLFLERLIYTDPYNPDTDGDGLLDGEEIGEPFEISLFGMTYQYYPMYSDPNNRDSDQDGLSDYEERRIYGTNPFAQDSDYDSLPDAFEVQYIPSDPYPLLLDTVQNSDDEVRIANSHHYSYYLNPRNKDTDGDGYFDQVELKDSRLDPTKPDMIISDRDRFNVRVSYNLGGRVHLYSPLTVERSGTLNLSPGTEIISYIPAYKGDSVTVYGILKSGSDSASQLKDKVVFKSGIDRSKDDRWRGIVAIEGADIDLQHTYVVKAWNALWLNGGVSVSVRDSAFDYNDNAVMIPMHSIVPHHYEMGTVTLDVQDKHFFNSMMIQNSAIASIRNSEFVSSTLYVESGRTVVDVILDRVNFNNLNGEYEAALQIKDTNGSAPPEVHAIDSTFRNSRVGILTSGGQAWVSVSGGEIANNQIGIKAQNDGYIYIDDHVQFVRNGQDYVIQKAGWSFPIYLAQGIALEVGGDILYLVPDMISFVQALASGKITFDTLRTALGAMWDGYEHTFINLRNNFSTVMSGNATKAETIQYGRDMALVIEVISVAKAAVKIGHKGLDKLVKDVDEARKIYKGKIPQNAIDIAKQIKQNNGTPPPGYKGGREFKNDGRGGGQILPQNTIYRV